MHILDEYPKIGGTKYCCGAYVKSFGEREIKIKGKNLLNQFLSLGIEKIIIFCPGCLRMMEMYSNLIPEFKEKIEIQTFSNYLIQKIENGDIFFKHKIDKNITFHDPCSWRNLSQIIFEGPRKLLNLLGAHVVEMEHNYKKTLCCGSPLLSSSEDYFNKVSGLRISEAQKAGADYIAVSCTGCLALAKPAQRENIEVYHILELVKKAFGDKIPHKIIEKSEKFNKEVKKILNKNPKIIAKRSIIRDGKLQNI
ncbi:MAG: (Fe-S)-binding protein [Candidatus Lokiarchaeota archaeon]